MLSDSPPTPAPISPQASNDPLAALTSQPQNQQTSPTPVTILVARKIKTGQEPAFETALQELQHILEAQPGFQDLKTYQPGTPKEANVSRGSAKAQTSYQKRSLGNDEIARKSLDCDFVYSLGETNSKHQ